jgi:hypothetical protein
METCLILVDRLESGNVLVAKSDRVSASVKLSVAAVDEYYLLLSVLLNAGCW